MTPEFIVYPDPPSLADAVAGRLVTHLVELTDRGAVAHLGLTGGGPGIAVLRSLATSGVRDSVPWQRLHLWWSDERFLPAGDPGRNDAQAGAALLAGLDRPGVTVHPMPASDGPYGTDADAAAEAYATLLASYAPAGQPTPEFDILLLGMGGEGHVASIFPESPAAVDTRTVVAVRHCPKPPPTRLSFTFPTLQRAREVWIVTAGAAKADAVSLVAAGAGPVQVPAAGARGTRRTLFLIDREAAAGLPADLRTRPV